MSIVLSQFARQRLFGSDPRVRGVAADEFETGLNQREPEAVLDGYAPFCKLHVHRNWTQTPVSAIRITPENEPRLRSAYEARTPEELPVLTRWFEGINPPLATWLIVILYSREQMAREGEELEADWGVVGVLATDRPEEIPMAPITMLRNALGVEEGGSGVAIDRDAYEQSVAFWNTHANWRPAPETES